MLISRLVPMAVRSSASALRNVGVSQPRRLISTTIPRPSGGQAYYREFGPMDKKMERVAEGFGVFMWWWIFWHCLTDYEHIIGHFDYVDVNAWTNEELGIPPDAADDPEYLR